MREGDDEFLHQRRRVAGLSLVGIASLGAVAAYQVGLVPHLPDPPLTVFDSDTVDASGEAYRWGSVPDGALAWRVRRTRTRRWLPVFLAAKTLADAASSLHLTAEQLPRHRKLCFYCLIAAAATIGTVPAALPEARAALRRASR